MLVFESNEWAVGACGGGGMFVVEFYVRRAGGARVLLRVSRGAGALAHWGMRREARGLWPLRVCLDTGSACACVTEGRHKCQSLFVGAAFVR